MNTDTDALVRDLRKRLPKWNVIDAKLMRDAADTTRERDEAVARERERCARLVKEQTGITLETLEYLASPIRTTKATT